MRELNYAYHHEQGGFELDYGEIKSIFVLKYEQYQTKSKGECNS